MGYQPRMRSPRGSGRGRGIPHHKAKARRQKRRPDNTRLLEVSPVASYRDVVERTLNGLRSLGRQVFALYPFSEHFSRWLVDVKVVLSEFESSPVISLDDQFVEERSRILSDVEFQLAEKRQSEVATEETARRLSEHRALLEQIEEEYASRAKELELQKADETKRLSSNVDGLRREVDTISGLKTGIFRGLSKKAKAQRIAEATQRLNQAEDELATAKQRFAARQEELGAELEKRKQPVISQVQVEQREIEQGEKDASLEARQAACEALINSVNALVERKNPLS
jgi:hypothetical protein